METINGASIYREAANPVTVDRAETHGAYSMLLGTLPKTTLRRTTTCIRTPTSSSTSQTGK
jgi:hypothetical protein